MKTITKEQALKLYEEKRPSLPYMSTNAIEKLEQNGYENLLIRTGKNAKTLEEELDVIFGELDVSYIRFVETNYTCVKGLRYTVVIYKGTEKEPMEELVCQ